MADILRRGWEYNLHRGTDAAGYMRFDAKTHKLAWYKGEGSALAMLNNEDMALPVSYVLGMHTRAGTNGDPKRNENNHPVEFKGVWVTHNGNINNHVMVKRGVAEAYGKQLETELPDVDSVAIPIVLSEFQPWQLDDIADALTDLQGGYAFHALWEDHPGVSLLVRGRSSPLMVRYHAAGGFVYASEDDATWQLIDAMGLDTDDKTWQVRDIDEYAMILVVDGVPVDFKDFKRMAWGTSTPHIVKRLLGDQIITTFDSHSDWATANTNLSLDQTDPKNVELWYTRDQGFTKSSGAKKFPITGTDMFAKLSEADNVYRIKFNKQMHAFYGNVEIVLSEHGTLRDVYHHDVIPDASRWVVEDREPETAPDNWDAFLKAKTSPVRNPVTTDHEPMYKTIRQNRNVVPLQPRVVTTSTSGGRTDGPISDGVVVGRLVTSENFYHYPFNKEVDDMYFFENRVCTDHEKLYALHDYPLDCGETLLAAMIFYSCLEEVELWSWIVGGTYIRTTPSTTEACRGGCKYEIYNRKLVTINGVSLSLPVGERCRKGCGSKRFVENLPPWISSQTQQQGELVLRSEEVTC